MAASSKRERNPLEPEREKGGAAMKKSNPYEIERTERRISAASSIAMCALTVIAQIAG